MSDKKSRDAQASESAKPAGLEEIDETAADGVVGGLGLNTTSLRSLSSAWLATTGVRDEVVDAYSEPVESEKQPSLPTK